MWTLRLTVVLPISQCHTSNKHQDLIKDCVAGNKSWVHINDLDLQLSGSAVKALWGRGGSAGLTSSCYRSGSRIRLTGHVKKQNEQWCLHSWSGVQCRLACPLIWKRGWVPLFLQCHSRSSGPSVLQAMLPMEFWEARSCARCSMHSMNAPENHAFQSTQYTINNLT